MRIFRKLCWVSVNVAFWGMVVLAFFALGSMFKAPVPVSTEQSNCHAVVLANPDDPYYPLALEIAAAEKAPLAHELTEVTAYDPVFLFWVVSPAFLSDAVMVEFGLAMKEQYSGISSGIITASTIDDARDLWERGPRVRNQNLFAVNAPSEAAHINAGGIISFAQGQTTISPLTKENFKNTLSTADYLTFTGHGGRRSLNLDEDTQITPEDVPTLNALVISAGSCQTVRPWSEDSIAIRFVDQGAAAYAGFVYSPNSGYQIGQFDGLPFRYTWPEFPIGHVIQVQNHGTLQGFANFPFLHLLGDPRIALQEQAPYDLVDDTREGEQRTLTFRDVPSGVIPIRIPGGAAYHFVEAPGITAAADRDSFYNSHLQMVNIHQDKFVLLVHQGGDLVLRLRPQAPWYWFPADVVLDSLDDTFIFSAQSGGDVLAIAFAVIPLFWLGRQLFEKRLGWQRIGLATIVGIGSAFLQGLYVLVRLDQVTITSKTVVFSPLSILAAFVLSACGTLIYLLACTRTGRVTAFLVATFTSWAPMVFGIGSMAAFNLLASIPELGTGIYNYSLGLLSAIPFLLALAFFGLTWRFIPNPRELLPTSREG